MFCCFLAGLPFLLHLLTDCTDDLLFVFCFRQSNGLAGSGVEDVSL